MCQSSIPDKVREYLDEPNIIINNNNLQYTDEESYDRMIKLFTSSGAHLFSGIHIWSIFCQWNRITSIVIQFILQQSFVDCWFLFIKSSIIGNIPDGIKDRVIS